ncbi:hypothetical protein [Nonomuraea typhae]|uniref:Uncharacterized protein n=1 Tax=Nonomuraea typhae TaxID=2603600 RepID=A0ABW7Z332_9ACTN
MTLSAWQGAQAGAAHHPPHEDPMQTHALPGSDADLLEHLRRQKTWTSVHFHCYAWTGLSAELRRPGTPRWPSDDGFAACPLPPNRHGDWLLKNPELIADNFLEASG